MPHIPQTDDLFYTQTGMDRGAVERVVQDALAGADDGELFLEYSQSENMVWDDGKLRSASFDTAQGFGLRSVSGETVGYAHASTLDESAIRRAAAVVKSVNGGHAGTLALPPNGTNRHLYDDLNPLSGKTSTRIFAARNLARIRSASPSARAGRRYKSCSPTAGAQRI